MQYKTIALQLLEQHPDLHQQLQKQRQLLPTMEIYARELKARHEALKAQLSQAKPASGESQIASAALEIAVKELEDRLFAASPPDGHETPTLDGAMAYIRQHTPPA
jgi:hypothetical protein